MNRLFVILVAFILCSGQIFAQHYGLAAGLRVGNNYGLSVQGKLFDKTSAEVVLHPGVGQQNNAALIMVKRHQKFLTDRLNVYAGGGICQYWNSKPDNLDKRYSSGGLQAIVGAEITLGRYNFSWDFTPAVLTWGDDSGAFKGGTAVSLRYVFIKPVRKKSKSNFWKNLSPNL